jgi:hypothetical protein
LAPPNKFSGQIKKNEVVQFCHQKLMTKIFWSPNLVIKKLDDQKTLITFDRQNKFDKNNSIIKNINQCTIMFVCSNVSKQTLMW